MREGGWAARTRTRPGSERALALLRLSSAAAPSTRGGLQTSPVRGNRLVSSVGALVPVSILPG